MEFGSVKMKFFVAVILLLISVDAMKINPHESELSIHLAGTLGCALGCTYKPQNVIQLPVCVAAARLGNNMTKLFRCGDNGRRSSCEKAKESDETNAITCVWIEAPETWRYSLRADGFCLPKIISDNKDAFIGVISAFQPIFESRTFPLFKHLMARLANSNLHKIYCQGLVCNVPSKFYPMKPDLTKLCLHDGVASIACPLLQTPAEGREFCPGKDPNIPYDKSSVCDATVCPNQIKTCPINPFDTY